VGSSLAVIDQSRAIEDGSTERMDGLLVDMHLESHGRQPEQIVLDLDATDIPLRSNVQLATRF
jgi:hypothetical protein